MFTGILFLFLSSYNYYQIYKKQWKFDFYLKLSFIFLYLGLSSIFRMIGILYVPSTWGGAYYLLISSNIIIHLGMVYILWFLFSTITSKTKIHHVIYFLIFGMKLGLLLYHDYTIMNRDEYTNILVLEGANLFANLVNISIVIPIIEIMYWLILKAKNKYISGDQSKKYEIFFAILFSYASLQIIAELFTGFYYYLLIEVGVLILYIGVYSLISSNPTFLILSLSHIEQIIIMDRSLSGLPLAQRSFTNSNAHQNLQILTSILQSIPVLLDNSLSLQLNDTTSFHSIQYGRKIIMLEFFGDISGYLFVDKYSPIVFSCLHNIMLEFKTFWSQEVANGRDSSFPLSEEEFSYILASADIFLPIAKNHKKE